MNAKLEENPIGFIEESSVQITEQFFYVEACQNGSALPDGKYELNKRSCNYFSSILVFNFPISLKENHSRKQTPF